MEKYRIYIMIPATKCINYAKHSDKIFIIIKLFANPFNQNPTMHRSVYMR